MGFCGTICVLWRKGDYPVPVHSTVQGGKSRQQKAGDPVSGGDPKGLVPCSERGKGWVEN